MVVVIVFEVGISDGYWLVGFGVENCEGVGSVEVDIFDFGGFDGRFLDDVVNIFVDVLLDVGSRLFL